MEQYLIQFEATDKRGKRILDLPEGRENDQPKRLWIVLNKGETPTLPYKPKHFDTAFLEDQMHDWQVRNGKLEYYGTACMDGGWLLLEYDYEQG